MCTRDRAGVRSSEKETEMTDGKNYLSRRSLRRARCTRRAGVTGGGPVPDLPWLGLKGHLGLSPRTLDRYRVTGGGPVPDLPWLGLKGPLVGPEDVGTDEGARR